tara:strand:+ start:348 stop:1385 length:1038 start_codon:yes stop_codon:yes gene_type:complete
MDFNIGQNEIGKNKIPVVFAEIGINHNGSLEEAKVIVDKAIEAGATIIKHQTHVVDDEMTDHAKSVVPGNADKSIYEIMESCALDKDDEYLLMKYIESKGASFISTPFSRAAANRLQDFDVEAFKIGSGECNNYPLIKHVANFKKPIILSTGMNDIQSIKISVNILREADVPFALLHCTNIYPTPPELVRLGAITQLEKEFPDAVIGLSDHTCSNHACFGAVALGARILERHFTDTMSRKGPDIECSMDPQALSELIQGSSDIFHASGGEKIALIEEESTIAFAFASVVTITKIKKGEIFSLENIWVKRPGTGEFLAKDFEDILGREANEDIGIGVQLKSRHINK